ncbi:methyl-accepting chemotaxis protein [Desulfobacterales bacterium HSG2]|nr:methyl-accepting chemotaxis protein [Desulfobacterales bacterium HSG2]
MHGAFEIISPLAEMRKEMGDARRDNLLVAFMLFVIAGGIFYFYLRSVIVNPIRKIIEFGRKLGKGDFSSELRIERDDEIGTMAENLNASANNLREMIERLSETTDMLSDSSGDLASVSTETASSAEHMNARSDTTASVAETVSVSVAGVASAAKQSSTSVSSIAAVTEEMFFFRVFRGL